MIPAPIETFRKMTDEQLYERMSDCQSPGDYQIAVEELQRRFLQRVETQTKSLAESSTRMEGLTKSLNRLTIMLLVMTVAQVVFFIWSLFIS